MGNLVLNYYHRNEVRLSISIPVLISLLFKTHKRSTPRIIIQRSEGFNIRQRPAFSFGHFHSRKTGTQDARSAFLHSLSNRRLLSQSCWAVIAMSRASALWLFHFHFMALVRTVSKNLMLFVVITSKVLWCVCILYCVVEMVDIVLK